MEQQFEPINYGYKPCDININVDIENLPSYISFCNNIFTKLGDKIRTNITITTYDNKNNKIENTFFI